MNESILTQIPNGLNTMQGIIINEVNQLIFDTVIDAENTSKEKQISKDKLIEFADDMSTQEKLDAKDKNYDRRNLERWQNALCFAGISLSILGITLGSPSVVKSVRSFLSTTSKLNQQKASPLDFHLVARPFIFRNSILSYFFNSEKNDYS